MGDALSSHKVRGDARKNPGYSWRATPLGMTRIWLSLALRTVVAAATGDHDSFDWSFADEAGLAFAAVDAMLQLKESFVAVSIDII